SRCTVPRVTGTERYAIELLRAILRLNTTHDITLYFRDAPSQGLFTKEFGGRGIAVSLPNHGTIDDETHNRVTIHVIPQRRMWTHTRFAAALYAERPDITFVPAHTLPFVFPGLGAVTVHDLGFRYFPDAHPPRQRLYLDLTTRTSAARASVILADSRATADDLTRFYGTDPVKIRVVYPGVDAPIIGDVEGVRRKYGLPARYFLFIGTLQPRKNIARIVQAYTQWRAAHPGDATGLVLAGGKGWLYDPAWAEGVPGVQITGYIDESDKGALLAGALALVFPSLYEGFGFPAVEAMHCGAPVIASRTSSLPELVGDAGLLVDPLSVDEIAAAMTRISDDAVLRASLILRGRAAAARFTWDAAGRAALDALESAAHG
ncbi:MAG: glycosyltransferase family 4 protein, partial [Anaerolineae bacterium]|nr:glycosyltransferase family 4 protein [Anaerolineae bacterium]